MIQRIHKSLLFAVLAMLVTSALDLNNKAFASMASAQLSSLRTQESKSDTSFSLNGSQQRGHSSRVSIPNALARQKRSRLSRRRQAYAQPNRNFEKRHNDERTIANEDDLLESVIEKHLAKRQRLPSPPDAALAPNHTAVPPAPTTVILPQNEPNATLRVFPYTPMTGVNNSLYLTPNVTNTDGLVEIKVGVLLPYSLPNDLTQQLTYRYDAMSNMHMHMSSNIIIFLALTQRLRYFMLLVEPLRFGWL